MPFQPKNTLWRDSLKAKVENKNRLQQFHEIIVNGGAQKYAAMMEDLAEGEKLPAPVKEFMDRYERHLEFVTPKLARADNFTTITIKDPKPVQKERLLKLLTKEKD